ncbi:hypothetical protein ES703_13124 [subsurface metagenome]
MSEENLRSVVKAYEKLHISLTLAKCGWNKSRAARILGIGLSTLYRRIDELKIKRSKQCAGSTRPEKNEDEIIEEKIWYKFFENLKTDDPANFCIFDGLITQFVEDYPQAANYVTLETLQAILKETQ